MNIKKYNQFLLERISPNFNRNFTELSAINEIDPIANAGELRHLIMSFRSDRTDFVQKIKLLKELFEGSFSGLASDKDVNTNRDFMDMQVIMDRAGWTLETIKKLFDTKVCELLREYFHDFIRNNELDELNGWVDIYLYTIDKRLRISEDTNKPFQVKLGGPGYELDGAERIEWVIKYGYGYHKTPYGQMYLAQSNVTPESFLNGVLDGMKDFFNENFSHTIFSYLHNKKILDKDTLNEFLGEYESNWGKYIVIEDEGFLVSYYKMCEDLDDFLNLPENSKYHDLFEIASDEDAFRKMSMDAMGQLIMAGKVTDTGEFIKVSPYF